MELGRHLVRELGFEDGVDTLGRWMAHHIAELIDEVEKGTTPTGRAKARKSAIEAILKVWEHRASLPGTAYPLAPYKNVLAVLDRLRPDNNPFRHYFPRTTGKDQFAAVLFDSLSRLVIALLLMKDTRKRKRAKVDKAAVRLLSVEERKILAVVVSWNDLFVSTPDSNEPGGAERISNSRGAEEINLNAAALRLIDTTTSALEKLRQEISKRENTSEKHTVTGPGLES